MVIASTRHLSRDAVALLPKGHALASKDKGEACEPECVRYKADLGVNETAAHTALAP
jgi:hypothetical protein